MKHLLQDLAKGNTLVLDAPAPNVSNGNLLINSTVSLISAGTERMVVDFGKANLVDKARQQPEKVKMVIEKVQTDGLVSTIDAVKSKLAQPIPLGYSNVGVVAEVGKGVKGFKLGDRVVSNGRHADVVRVPRNLCATIPENVSDEDAVFTVVASIGLQGIRLALPTIGEFFVVIGTGLIGLLTVQLLRANGCRVMAIDLDQAKLGIAQQFGAEVCNPSRGEDPVEYAMAYSKGHGADGVIITASTKSCDPVTQGARMSRKRGRIVLVGVTGLELNRSDFYEKELSFQVSCSYGPGRYDPVYEEQGHDYPYGFVRWTEQRNFEAILSMMQDKRLDVKPLISHRFSFDDAADAYNLLSADKSVLGILLEYNSEIAKRHNHVVKFRHNYSFELVKPVVSFVGAGNYASRVLMPAFKEAGAQLNAVVTSGGVSGAFHGKKMGFARASTDVGEMLADKETNTIVVATRHNTHAQFVVAALKAGKNVFVEKPLAINRADLSDVETAYSNINSSGYSCRLMVGFNRRFSKLVEKMKDLLDPIKEPKTLLMTMNAGEIPSDHWTQDTEIGGGRIIGEACHYIDLMRFLVGEKIISVQCRKIGDKEGITVTEDKAVIILGFSDGSFGTIHYLANGSKSFPKERVEVFVAGRVLQLDNFRRLKGFGWSNFSKLNLMRQDKGQKSCPVAFLDAIERGSPSPIPIDEIFEVARVTLEAADLLRNQV